MLEKDGVVQRATESREPVTYRGRREVQMLCRPTDVPLTHDGLEQDQQIEVDGRKVNFAVHGPDGRGRGAKEKRSPHR
jgi:hypothetical protein